MSSYGQKNCWIFFRCRKMLYDYEGGTFRKRKYRSKKKTNRNTMKSLVSVVMGYFQQFSK